MSLPFFSGVREKGATYDRYCHGVHRHRQLASRSGRALKYKKDKEVAPVQFRHLPPDLRPPPSTAALRRLEERVRGVLVKILEDYRLGHLTVLVDTLDNVMEDLRQGQSSVFSVLFLSLHGADVLVELLCTAPGTGETADGGHRSAAAASNSGRHSERQGSSPPRVTFSSEDVRSYVSVLSVAIEMLAELCLTHSGLIWYMYDHYPCLIFRMIDLIPTSVGHFSIGLLDNMFSCTGPIIEIAKEPVLISLLESCDDYVLSLLCHVLVPLALPCEGGAGSSNRSSSPRLSVHKLLLYPEHLTSMYRVQRVLDSNVLWLQSCPRFMDRLLGLTIAHRSPKYSPIRAAQLFARQLELGLTALDTTRVEDNNNNTSNSPVGTPLTREEGEATVGNPWRPVVRARTDVFGTTTRIIATNLSTNNTITIEGRSGTRDRERGRGEGEERVGNAGSPTVSANMSDLLDTLSGMRSLLLSAGDERSGPSAAAIELYDDELLELVNVGIGNAQNENVPVGASSAIQGRRGADMTSASGGDASMNYSLYDDDEEGYEEDDDEEEEDDDVLPPQSLIDMSWLFGQHNTLQRWEERDRTLVRSRDDNREALFGPLHYPLAIEKRMKDLPDAMLQVQVITEAQREAFFLLSTCLCTFFFCKAFKRAKECQLVKRANHMFDYIFGRKRKTSAASLSLNRSLKAILRNRHFFNAPPSSAYRAILSKALQTKPASMQHLPAFHPPLTAGQQEAPQCFRCAVDNSGEDQETKRAAPQGTTNHSPPNKEEWDGRAEDAQRCRRGALQRRVWSFPCYFSLVLHPFVLQTVPHAVANLTLLLDESVFHTVGDTLTGSEIDSPSGASIRKWEFLRCLSEYWNVQTLQECQLVTSYGEEATQLLRRCANVVAREGGGCHDVRCLIDGKDGENDTDENALLEDDSLYAYQFAKKTVLMLLKRCEDCTVEADGLSVIERYLRCYAPRSEMQMEMARKAPPKGKVNSVAKEGEIEQELKSSAPPPMPPIRYSQITPTQSCDAIRVHTISHSEDRNKQGGSSLGTPAESDKNEVPIKHLVSVKKIRQRQHTSQSQCVLFEGDDDSSLSYRRCARDMPNVQDEVGALLLPSILKDRIYNATVVPSLSCSLTPLWRTEKVVTVLAELLLYHYRHLVVLSDYVLGEVSLKDGPNTMITVRGEEEEGKGTRSPRRGRRSVMVVDTEWAEDYELEYEEELEEGDDEEDMDFGTASTPASPTSFLSSPASRKSKGNEELDGDRGVLPYGPLFPPGTEKQFKISRTKDNRVGATPPPPKRKKNYHPPLERGEDEPFGSVLLRRIYTLGFYSPLLIRSLILSLTPGLRSSVNFVYQRQRLQVAEAEKEAERLNGTAGVLPTSSSDPEECSEVTDVESRAGVRGEEERYRVVVDREVLLPQSLFQINHSSEFLWKMFLHMIRIRRLSRQAVEEVCLYKRVEKETPRADGDVIPQLHTPFPPPPQGLVRILRHYLRQIQECPYGPCRDAGRPMQPFFDSDDWSVLTGMAVNPAPGLSEPNAIRLSFLHVGSPACCRIPLFDEAIEEEKGLERLMGLEDALLSEPHKLLYSLLSPLQAESVNSTTRLSVITTVILIVMREAKRFGGAEGIHRLLRRVQRLVLYIEEERTKLPQDAGGAPTGSGCSHFPSTAAVSQLIQVDFCSRTGCICPSYTGAGPHVPHCPAQQLFGSCTSSNSAQEYYRRHGNCFFKNFFRLLFVWVGHYAVLQRYVVTLFFSSEVAFLDYKQVVLLLIRELPNYFRPIVQ